MRVLRDGLQTSLDILSILRRNETRALFYGLDRDFLTTLFDTYYMIKTITLFLCIVQYFEHVYIALLCLRLY